MATSKDSADTERRSRFMHGSLVECRRQLTEEIDDPERRVELAQLVLERAARLIADRDTRQLSAFGHLVNSVLTDAGLPRSRESLHRTRPACLMQAVADLARELDRQILTVEALQYAHALIETVRPTLQLLRTPRTVQDIRAARISDVLLNDLYAHGLVRRDDAGSWWITPAGASALITLSRR